MKDYKKILEYIVNIINTTEKSDIGFANICTYIGENCPELADSEDERIRKGMLAAFKGADVEFWSDEELPIKDIIAWLEKQEPANKVEPNDYSSIDPYFGKPIEQKPADKVEPKFKVGDKIKYSSNVYDVLAVKEHYYELSDGNVCEFKNQDKWQLVEQNPAWSEEDSPYYDDICEILINLLHSESADVNKDVVQKDLDWIQSIKDRVQPLPKPEWSEKDEEMIEKCLQTINHDRIIHVPKGGDSFHQDEINWLKSFRPQKQWKPSEEEKTAL